MHGLEEKMEFLRSVDLFAALEPELLGKVASRCGLRELAAGELLFAEGDPGDTLFIVARGAVEVFHADPWHETVLARLEQGQFFGEMAVLGQGRRTTSCRAASPATLLFLKEKAIRTLVNKIPGVAFGIFACLIGRLEQANRKLTGEPETPDPLLEVTEGQGQGAVRVLSASRIELGAGLDGPTPRPDRINLPAADEPHQAELVRHHGAFYLRSVSDSAPALLNGEPVIGAVGLKSGDLIALGRNTLRFSFPA